MPPVAVLQLKIAHRQVSSVSPGWGAGRQCSPQDTPASRAAQLLRATNQVHELGSIAFLVVTQSLFGKA